MSDNERARVCIGSENHTCTIDLSDKPKQVKRCEVCAIVSKREQTKLSQRKRRSRYISNKPNETESVITEEIAKGILLRVKNGCPNAVICDELNVTRKQIRETVTGHYQRRATFMELQRESADANVE